MLRGNLAKALGHIAAALTYAVAYLAFREASNDQWYLPAGLRFVTLLMLPVRFWPAMYIGEIGALAYVRHSMIDEGGITWFVVSLFPNWPVVASFVYLLRKRTAAPKVRKVTDAAGIVVAALLSAEATSLMNKSCSALLKLDGGPMKYSDLITYSLGDFQGILVATFAMTLYAGRCANAARENMFRIESLCAAGICALLSAGVVLFNGADPATIEAGRLLLLVPAIALAIRHGWRGAAAGAIISNLALFWTIPHQEAGQSDGAGLLMQEAFTFVACALFVLGARIHERATESAKSNAAEREARQLAKAGFASTESELRERALRAERMHESSQATMRTTIDWLRSNGHSEVAMGLIGAVHRQALNFEQLIIDGIYPLTLERDGLFAALSAEAFLAPFDRAGVECDLDLTGAPHGLTREAQLTAYRVIVEATDYLMASGPNLINVRVRCTRRAERGHISVALSVHGTTVGTRTSVDTARLARLRGRVSAYEGSFHSRPHRLRIILLDASPEAPTEAPEPKRAWSPRIVARPKRVPIL